MSILKPISTPELRQITLTTNAVRYFFTKQDNIAELISSFVFKLEFFIDSFEHILDLNNFYFPLPLPGLYISIPRQRLYLLKYLHSKNMYTSFGCIIETNSDLNYIFSFPNLKSIDLYLFGSSVEFLNIKMKESKITYLNITYSSQMIGKRLELDEIRLPNTLKTFSLNEVVIRNDFEIKNFLNLHPNLKNLGFPLMNFNQENLGKIIQFFISKTNLNVLFLIPDKNLIPEELMEIQNILERTPSNLKTLILDTGDFHFSLKANDKFQTLKLKSSEEVSEFWNSL